MTVGIENMLRVAQGEFVLARLPKRPKELLQAFDAADEYLLNFLAESGRFSVKDRVLIVNDSFGALTVALHANQPWAMSDSYLSQQATRLNLTASGLSEQQVSLINSLEQPVGWFDWVLIKAPKTLALLEDQLIRLRSQLTGQTQVIVAGMVKNLPPSVWKLLERLVGATTTSLAKKKARLIFTQFDESLVGSSNPYPVTYQLENTGYSITNHANVFSRDSLDIGTRFFLQHLSGNGQAIDIVDLGCGNGVVGLIAAERNPNAVVHFIDESFMAVASAQVNFQRAFGTHRQATFAVGDGLTEFAANSADLILCNPPFHQQHTQGDQIALGMFMESRRVLRKNGELWVIGNRHLNYHLNLRRLFGNHSIIAANAKFVIYKASC